MLKDTQIVHQHRFFILFPIIVIIKFNNHSDYNKLYINVQQIETI